MKKIIARKGALIYLVPAVVFVPITVFFLMQGIYTQKIANFVWFAVFGFLCAYSLIYVNRYACFVWFDGKNIGRRGFFCGFKRLCSLDSVKKIGIRTVFKEGEYVFLIDAEGKRFDPFSKNGYICFKLTARNTEFLRTFHDGEPERIKVDK